MNHPTNGPGDVRTDAVCRAYWSGVRGGTITFFPGDEGVRVELVHLEIDKSVVCEFGLNSNQILDLLQVVVEVLIVGSRDETPS